MKPFIILNRTIGGEVVINTTKIISIEPLDVGGSIIYLPATGANIRVVESIEEIMEEIHK